MRDPSPKRYQSQFLFTGYTKVVRAVSPNPHPMVANRLPHSYLIHSNQVNTQEFASLAV